MLLPRESAHSLITPEISGYMRSLDWPSGLQMSLKDEQTHEGLSYIQFILYRDNFILFDGEEHVKITALVKEMMEKLRSNNIPIFLEIKASRGDG